MAASAGEGDNGRVSRTRELVRRYPWVIATIAVAIAGLVTLPFGWESERRIVLSAFCLIVAAVQAWQMVKELIGGRVGVDILAITAIVSTVAVGDYWASLVVVLMITGGEALEDYASARARREVTALLDRAPRTAHRVGADGAVADVPVDAVAVGDLLLLKPGEAAPVDATLEDDEGEFDESSLTGESMPVTHRRGSTVLSGSINGDSVVRLRAARASKDSEYQRIVALVQAASNSKAPFVRLADRFAVPFTIVAFAIAGIAWAVAGDAQRFAEVLVVATPCPLLIAAPVAFIGGMSRSARHGVIVKSGGTLEQLARVRTVAFDKTGTLTFGHPVVDRVQPSPGVEADAVARDAAAAEQYSSHVLARAIVAAAPQGATVPAVPADQVVETTGEGVTATVDGRVVAVGKASWVAGHSAPFTPDPLEPGETAVYVAAAGRPVGRIVLRDEVRPNAKSTIARLRELGVRHTLMLTGDAAATADHVAHELGISEVRAGLLPEGKVRAVAAITDRPAMMIGDGVNDAPVLAAADVGVAMGAKGSTAASESADVVIMVDDLGRAPVAISVAQRTISVAVQSIWIGISLSIVLMLVAAFGVIPAIIGAALQELVDLTSILNSLRSLGEGRRGASQSTERAGAMTASARGSTRAEM